MYIYRFVYTFNVSVTLNACQCTCLTTHRYSPLILFEISQNMSTYDPVSVILSFISKSKTKKSFLRGATTQVGGSGAYDQRD